MLSFIYAIIVIILQFHFNFANETDDQANKLIRFRRYYSDRIRFSRAATARVERIWPEGIIPYVITSNFSGEHQHLFLRAMRHWENYTCISFIPKQSHHKHYITFTVDKCGCCSYVGRRGEGPQAISIGKNCDKFGIVVHELGHVVGFWHEHTRPDRDLYVDIFYKSIQTGQDYNFEKSKPEEVDSLGEPYDFSSIMHYARDTFSRGAFHDTILPKPSSGFRSEIGQRVQLSEGDIRQTKKLYKCLDCGSTLMQESGNLKMTQPGICVWHIIAPRGHTIFLNITGSVLPEPDYSCADENKNVITVRDGVSITSPLLDKICGSSSLFRTIASSGNRMVVQVKSTFPSLQPFATYYAICGGPIYANEGVIQSPKYPESYPPNSDCQWTINVDEDSQIAIQFVYFHLEQHKECIYDRLIISEGLKSQESNTFCGFIEKNSFVSKGNQLSLRFFSDNSVQKTGFEVRFSKELNECATERNNCQHYCVNIIGGFKCACRAGFSLSSNGYSCESTCGGYIKASNGSISSPNYPEMYPSSKTCIWEIEADEGYHIFLNFTNFNVEGMRTECSYDYVKIGDSEKLCGEYHEPLLFTTPMNRVRIEFSSDSSVERDGFFANFIADFDECQYENGGCEHRCQNRLGSYICTCNAGYILSEDKHNCKEGSCFFELNAPSGEIMSPSFPNDYPKSQNCSWHFVTTPGHRLMLTFSVFLVEEHSQCKYDAVYVYDGGDVHSPLAGMFCGLQPPPLLLSSSNEMFLAFSSDASVSRKGFQAQYASVCGGRLIAETTPGHIYSHATFSDSRYEKNQDCSWIVSAKNPSRGIRLHFSTFTLESENGCQYDYVEVYDGTDAKQESLVGRFCGDLAPEPITSAEMEKWMEELPESSKRLPLFQLSIPGSHDSGAYRLHTDLPLAHDQSFSPFFRKISKLKIIRKIVKRWSETQSLSVSEQLRCGIRYFDLRFESFEGEDPFLVHALYGESAPAFMKEVKLFLDEFKKEVVLLDINHIYEISLNEFAEYFVKPLNNLFGPDFICPTTVDIGTATLEELVKTNHRLIVIGPYSHDVGGIIFSNCAIKSKWPRVNKTSDLIDFLRSEIRSPNYGRLRVLQGVLTAKSEDIAKHPLGSLRKDLSLPALKASIDFVTNLNSTDRKNLNIIISDQINQEFVNAVISTNTENEN